MFSLAVIMCVCCIGSFSIGSSDAIQGSAIQDHPVGITLQEAPQQPTGQNIYLSTFISNFSKLVCILAFAFVVALFPKEEIMQWAARKPFFRRIFNF